MVSTDGGATWSDPAEFVPATAAAVDREEQTDPPRDGTTWLAPASVETGSSWDAFVDRSTDGGRSWNATAFVPLDHGTFAGKGVIQPALWESAPARSTCSCAAPAVGSAAATRPTVVRPGRPAAPTALPNNNSGIDLARLPAGVLALACNPVSGNWAARTPLSVLLSTDNGRSWPRRLNLETGAGEYSYPAVIPHPTGVAVTYTWNRKRIGFWHASLDFVLHVAESR